jgi:hypothetical protein
LRQSLVLQAKSRCVHSRPLLAPIYRWPGIKETVGSMQIRHVMAVYILFHYSNTTYVGSYLGPISIWALTQIYPRGTNARALAGVPLSVAPEILSEL